MIYNFKVENFCSIREMQELNFEEPKKFDDSVVETNSGKFLNTISCFIGNNASGKTNILKALSFFMWFIEDSYYELPINKEIPFKKHKLCQKKSTKFEIIFDNSKGLFKLELELNKDEILREKLSIKRERAFSKIYSVNRLKNQLEIDYNNNRFMNPINKEDKKRFEEKKNSSFLSFITNMGYLSEYQVKKIVPNINSNVTFIEMHQPPNIVNCIKCSNKIESKKELKDLCLKYIKKFDLGITDISLDKARIIIEDSDGKKVEEKILTFKHGEGNKSFELTAFDESAGTIQSLSMLFDFFEVFETGGLVIIDEIESHMHPNILRKLIGLFGNKTVNTKNAQLFFSTHQPLFLNDRLKRQIFLVEKTNMIDTEVFRLDCIKPTVRNDENFFMKYLSGEYGAVPYLEAI